MVISSAVRTAPNPGIFLVKNFTAAFVANAPPALVAIISAKLLASPNDVPISGTEYPHCVGSIIEPIKPPLFLF
uniref:Uncharacterized protein n=1 Tax=Podoviridae sp. ctG4L18 TaxID=2825234 RepID=A0A8S5UNZ6_9CAUD|nr:MAG TPA: hypothetical protein [Podoviridae sp. ctG4L18]